ncbi:uncharacterized protein LOC143216498 isoform X1 [Lasioglossum baleicum]|uniref:uncharacterized protein LOC143216498 isoform X1 n=1 Tax=Lasioglossum baleicum TaxID=434251 RepID=UPI003FCD7B9E
MGRTGRRVAHTSAAGHRRFASSSSKVRRLITVPSLARTVDERGCCTVHRDTSYIGLKPPTATGRMLKSASPQYPSRGGSDVKVIRLTVDQEAVLQEQFNRWPRAPHTADVVLLAAETGLSEADVEAWYAIRLAQWRKEQGLGGNLGLH